MIPSIESLSRAKAIIESIEQLQAELAGLFGGTVAAAGKRRGRPAASVPGVPAGPAPARKRKMSPEGRARIAAAAKARWARFRADKKKAAK